MRFPKVVTLGAGAAFAAIAIGGVSASAFTLGFEHATVTITPPTRYIDMRTTLHGALSGGDFQTQRLQVTLTETMQGRASGVASTPGRYATGSIVFNHTCAEIGTPPNVYCAPTQSVPAGTPIYTSTGLVSYVLQRTVSCFCGESIQVRATKPGVIGNTGAHTINLYGNRLAGVGGFTPWESADNPAPIAGGADGTAYSVVQKADLDSATTILRSRLTADLAAALQTKAKDLHYVADLPVLAATTDHSAGAPVASFQVIATGSLTATAFADSDARSRIAAALATEVAPGWRQVGRPLITEYELVTSTSDGGVTVSGDASGYEARLVSTAGLATRLRGLAPDFARATAEAAAPGSSVDIQVSPASIPWLPMNADHIAIVVNG